MLLLLLAQAAPPQSAPDIALNATIRARQVTIEKQGNASLIVTTSPDGGNVVDVRAPKADGRRELRDVEVKVRAEARIVDPAQAPRNIPDASETGQPQSR
jgi:hypothetical protein